MGTFREISADEFVRRVAETAGESDKRYAFLIGAGCSVTSDIPAAGALVRNEWLPRLHRLRGATDPDVAAWAVKEFPHYAPDAAAGSYGAVMEALFLQPEDRQREIERLCDGKFPGFGYAVLASLMALPHGAFNVALTTNFDDLIADAMYLFTSARPLVIQHESLARFIRPTRSRPLVVKMHGDNRLAPQNTRAETSALKQDIEKQVSALLHDRGLIVLGYGGNDEGIAKMFEALPAEALPLGVFWVSGEKPVGSMREWLERREAVWVRSGDFDQLMLLFQDAFQLDHPDSRRFDSVFRRYTERYDALSKRVAALPDDAPEARELKAAAERGEQAATAWWSVKLAADRAAREGRLAEAEGILDEGLRRFPDNASLLLIRATYVLSLRRDTNEAERLVRHALQLDPYSGDTFVILGHLLRRQGRLDEARRAFEDAIEVEPDDADLVAALASFELEFGDERAGRKLWAAATALPGLTGYGLNSWGLALLLRGEVDDAQAVFESALDAAQPPADALINLANCLWRKGRARDAFEIADQGLSELDPIGLRQGRLEVWWLRAVYSRGDERRMRLQDLRSELIDGSRLGRFAHAGHVAHDDPDEDLLLALAAVIEERRSLSDLDEFELWRALDSG